MKNDPLVSVIMPAFNAERYIEEAIQSVIDQSYASWELLVVNDGSDDGTVEVVLSFEDARIKLFNQSNKGVSAARNVGLQRMKGDLFCFLDSDDCFTQRSISARVVEFTNNANTDFVDGSVKVMNSKMNRVLEIWKPTFSGGNPFEDLVRISGNSFFGPSWMIRNRRHFVPKFDETITHCEDLLFFLLNCEKGGLYSTVEECILKHREHEGSVMGDVKGLESGYLRILEYIRNVDIVRPGLIMTFKLRILRIICFFHLKQVDFRKALFFFLRVVKPT